PAEQDGLSGLGVATPGHPHPLAPVDSVEAGDAEEPLGAPAGELGVLARAADHPLALNDLGGQRGPDGEALGLEGLLAVAVAGPEATLFVRDEKPGEVVMRGLDDGVHGPPSVRWAYGDSDSDLPGLRCPDALWRTSQRHHGMRR